MNTRVLILGGRRWDQAIITIGRGFLKIGCAVRYLPTRRPGTHSEPLENVHDVIGQIVKEFEPDILFWVMCKEDCPVGLMDHLKQLRPEMATVFHSFDDPHMVDNNPPECIPGFDFAVTCCAGSIPWYADRGVKAIRFWPPPGFDLHGKASANPAEKCDISFVGTNVYPRDKYPEVIATRAEILRAVAGLGTINIYGPWGERRFDWGGEFGVPEMKKSWRGFRKYEELPGVYAASKINLSSHVRPDGFQYLNERTINAMGAGGFMLVDKVAGMEEIFTDGVHWATWESLDELSSKAKFYLANPDKRKAIAAKGREKALKEFSNKCHAHAVLKLCGKD